MAFKTITYQLIVLFLYKSVQCSSPELLFKGCGVTAVKPALNIDQSGMIRGTEPWNQLRIIGGSYAKPDSYPWMVFIRVRVNSSTMVFGGGSLIAPQWVLTAAHILFDVTKDDQTGQFVKKQIFFENHRPSMVFVGAHNTTWPRYGSSTRVVNAEKVIWHPQYFHRTDIGHRAYDIALIKLKEPVEILGSDNNPVPVLLCLPKSDDNFRFGRCKRRTQNAVVAGWGSETPTIGGEHYVFPEALKHLVTSVVSCNDSIFKQELRNMTDTYPEHWLCTHLWHGAESGTCTGDSGGPLFGMHKHKFTQYGVTVPVAGKTCVAGNDPDMFIHVPPFREWIDEQLTLNSDVQVQAELWIKGWLYRLLSTDGNLFNTVYDAVAECERRGGRLAKIPSASVMAFVSQLSIPDRPEGNTVIWVDGYTNVSDNTPHRSRDDFQFSDKTAVPKAYFGEERLLNPVGQCLVVLLGRLENVPCSSSHPKGKIAKAALCRTYHI